MSERYKLIIGPQSDGGYPMILDVKLHRTTRRIVYATADYISTVDWLNEREKGYSTIIDKQRLRG